MLETPWTTERVGLLVRLWDESVRTRLIAERINAQTGSAFTKNAVIGKANRLGLSKPRERPEQKQPHWSACYRAQLSENASICMWPTGHPDDTDFHFCGTKSLPSKPYCRHNHDAEHDRSMEEAAKRREAA